MTNQDPSAKPMPINASMNAPNRNNLLLSLLIAGLILSSLTASWLGRQEDLQEETSSDLGGREENNLQET